MAGTQTRLVRSERRSARTSGDVFRFALITTDGDALGPVAFARSDFKPGDVIPQGRGASLRVVNVVEPDRDGELPLLVVDLADPR
jgi:hypothetical protein